MKKLIALTALVVLGTSCEPFPDEKPGYDDAREGFDRWKEAMIAGRLTDCVQLMTLSLRSQWIHDRLSEGDRAVLEWKSQLKGTARTDLDLWFTEAARDQTRGRVTTLPPSVLADPSVTPLLVGYLRYEQPDVARDFKQQTVVQISADDLGVSILVRGRNSEPEIYQLVFEQGFWKVDGHRKKSPR